MYRSHRPITNPEERVEQENAYSHRRTDFGSLTDISCSFIRFPRHFYQQMLSQKRLGNKDMTNQMSFSIVISFYPADRIPHVQPFG